MATMAMDSNIIKVALTGNPNTGKSTIFNEITGARQKIGNWPGVTVDKKEGHVTFEGKHIQVIDLPGTYSVNARSPEEKIVIDYLQEAELDLVVDVIDSSNLERNLFLTVQLLEKGIPHESGVWGWDFPLGSTGLCALGNGYYYVSHDGKGEDGWYTHVKLYRWDGASPLAMVE